MKFEQDALEILGGVRHGKTLGSPVSLVIGNSEWPKWTEVMAVSAVDEEGRRYDEDGRMARGRGQALTRPRPGHADLAGMLKYGFDDIRPVLERASARETATRVALGAFAKELLKQALGVDVVGHVVGCGSVAVPEGLYPKPGDAEKLDAEPMRCIDPDTSARMQQEIDDFRAAGDTLGGVVEVLVYGLPPGVGSYVHGDRRLDAALGEAMLGIQAIKGMEIGDGFVTATRPGSRAHDEIEKAGERDGKLVIRRLSARAGGIEGGMSTGEAVRLRAALKPISSVPRALSTVDVATKEPASAIHQRSDVCAIVPTAVVAEYVTALTVARAVLEKFGGDSVEELRRNVQAYVDGLGVVIE
jgi:chorismate synthase